MPHPGLADDIVVYAPDSPERRDFLALVERFNARGARWRVDVVTSSAPLETLLAERRGDVVVLAGKNGGKAATIRRLHDAGFHVLADKPWLVDPEDLDDIRAALSGPPVVTEIMTGRHDVAARLVQRLVDSLDVFGAFRADASPAIEIESVHGLEKLVDGAPLRRPWWYFDVRVQGRGLVDLTTHMVDRAQSLAPGPLALIGARTWPTRVPREAFARITGERAVPAALKPFVDGDALGYDCNAALTFRIGDVTARAQASWVLTQSGGDTSTLVVRGTRADVRLEQSARTKHMRQLIVEPHDGAGRAADHVAHPVDAVVRAAAAEFPGVRVERRRMADAMGAATLEHDALEVVIPPGIDGGHEAHFALVLDGHLRTVDDARWPAALAARTLAKYELLADAARATPSR